MLRSLQKFTVEVIRASSFVIIAFSITSCHSRYNTQAIFGNWVVDDLRVDEGQWRSQSHTLHDKNYIGKLFTITAHSVTSNLKFTDSTEGVDCVDPHYSTMKMPLRKLFYGTLGWRNYPPVAATPANYEFPDNPKPIEIIVVTCRMGGVGDTEDTPTIPFPREATWLARIDDRHLVIHWFDDSMLVLSRPDDRQAAVQRAKLLQGLPDEKPLRGLVARRKAELSLFQHGIYK